jgi:hypothetical protein
MEDPHRARLSIAQQPHWGGQVGGRSSRFLAVSTWERIRCPVHRPLPAPLLLVAPRSTVGTAAGGWSSAMRWVRPRSSLAFHASDAQRASVWDGAAPATRGYSWWSGGTARVGQPFESRRLGDQSAASSKTFRVRQQWHVVPSGTTSTGKEAQCRSSCPTVRSVRTMGADGPTAPFGCKRRPADGPHFACETAAHGQPEPRDSPDAGVAALPGRQ